MGLYVEKGMSRSEKRDLALDDFVDMVGNPKRKDRTLFVIGKGWSINSDTRVYLYFHRSARIMDNTEDFQKRMIASCEIVGFKDYSYRDIRYLLKRWKQTLPRLTNMNLEDSNIRCGVTIKYY
ncbi:hypothetical protein ABCW44_09400 [Mannheimia haemolytica]|uniref:hypothetical protein n=1 Tax=Mannheimia haemolytica TaxID=75985 RepID=UPI002E9E909F|nr:hypothetical protein [Mannheimia haemolytica]